MRSLKFAALILLVASNCYGQTAKAPQRSNELQITAMRAMLFFETSGAFSPDVFTNEVNLWNTPIEGASRAGASESMLVVVEVSGSSAGWVAEGRKVQLTARYRIADVSGYGKPAFFSKAMRINIGSDNKFFGGFGSTKQVVTRSPSPRASSARNARCERPLISNWSYKVK